MILFSFAVSHLYNPTEAELRYYPLLHSHSSEVPNFFASTKFFSCLDLKESQELFEATQMVC